MNAVYEKRKTQRITLLGDSSLPVGYYIDRKGRELLAEPNGDGEVLPVIGNIRGQQILVRVSSYESDAIHQREFVRRARESGLCVLPETDRDEFGRQIREYVVTEKAILS